MSATPLPTIEQWLSALTPRVRALRVALGTSRLVAAALGAASFVLLLDAGFSLPAWARGLFLSVWLTAVGVLTWRWVLVPWRGELPLSEVAHEVGKRMPELGERLRVAVAAAPGAAHAADTAQQLKAVGSAQAVPVKPVAGLVAGAVLAVLAVVATAVLVPGSADRLRRVAAPWSRNGAHAFRVVVTSGEPVVRRGGPVTLSAYAERVSSTATGTPEAILVTRDAPDAPEVRTPMAADGLTFHTTRSGVPADFEYRVEIGAARSEWFRVAALDAVDLGPGTAIEIVPPEYASSVPKRTLAALGDIAGLQFGSVAFRLVFTQPAAAGHLDWRPVGDAKGEMIALEFAPDRLSATAKFPLRTDGSLRLILLREEGGKRLRTDTVASVRVATDEPPRFEQLSGAAARARAVTPATRIAITFVALDDLSVTGAELQYVVGPDESKRVSVPVPLTGGGTPRAAGRLDFNLSDKAREGDTLRFRIVASDNRAVDADRLGPQTATFPREGWSELRVAATAPPLDEQNVACARDALHDALASALKGLKEAGDEAAAIRAASDGSESLPLDLSSRLGTARDKVRAARDALRDAAGDAALVPESRELAPAVADGAKNLAPAEDALRRAETDSPAVRAEALGAAAAHLRGAEAALDELLDRNRAFAHAGLDRLKLTALAADQAALAGAKPGPEFAARQRGLLARFAALLDESDRLRAAYDSAKADEFRRLAAELTELTAQVRDLDDAAARTGADARTALVSAVAREQTAIAKLAEALFARTETAARLAGAAPPRAEDFLRVAKLVAAGNGLPALTEIERHAAALDRLAATFEALAAERADPKLAARHLAHWQSDLLGRFRAAPGGFAALPDAARATFRAEQTALAAATERLSLPPEEPVKTAHTDARRHAELARDFLARDGAGAEDAMKAAVRSLGVLSDRTPQIGERISKSRNELEKIRADFEASANAVDQALRMFDRQPPDALAKRLSPQADRQRKLIAGVASLDLPGQTERQARVAIALTAAANDLQNNLPLDVQASQLWARRELERLKLVLEGTQPPDARAEELYRKLTAAADALDALGPTAPVAPAVQEANRQLAQAPAADAPTLVNDARGAAQGAEAALRDAKPDAACRVRAAADAVGRLAERLHGFESDVARVKRLAALRRAGAGNPKELLTSDEAVRQLGREFEELTRTRVGANGQVLKKRALDLYAKLRAKTDPDRVGTDLRALAAALDELAPKMIDQAELAAGGARPAQPPPHNADEFLPSKPLADAVRELERRQRAIHALVANLPVELAARLRPAAVNPFAPLVSAQADIARDARVLAKELGSDLANQSAAVAALAADRLRAGRGASAEAERAANSFRQLAVSGAGKPWGTRAAALAARQGAVLAELTPQLERPTAAAAQQVARAAELGRCATEFATRLTGLAETFAPDGPEHKSLTATAAAVRETEKRLTEAVKKTNDGSAAEAEKQRTAAIDALRGATEALGSPPAGATVAPGEALRATERAMRKALTEPGSARDAAGAIDRAKRE